jgi:hypothetical protein
LGQILASISTESNPAAQYITPDENTKISKIKQRQSNGCGLNGMQKNTSGENLKGRD